MSNILIKKNYLQKLKLLKKYDKFYYDQSTSIISDQEYDNLKKKYLILKKIIQI